MIASRVLAVFLILPSLMPVSSAAEQVSVSDLVNTPAVFENDRNADDRVAGRVQDVLLNRDGRIVSVLVNRNIVASARDDTVTAPVARRRSAYEQLYEFAIAGVQYDRQRRVLYVGADEQRYFEAENVARMPLGQVRATELFKLPVNLLDKSNAGKVEDVLVDFEQERAVGIVVDTAPIFETLRLFPPELDAYDRSEQTLNFGLSESELEALPKVASSS